MAKRKGIEIIAEEDKEPKYDINKPPLCYISDSLEGIYNIIEKARTRKIKNFFKSKEFQDARDRALRLIINSEINSGVPRVIIAPYRRIYAQIIKEARKLSIFNKADGYKKTQRVNEKIPYKHRVDRRKNINSASDYHSVPINLFSKDMERGY